MTQINIIGETPIPSSKKLITILGPTASGKTSLGVALARHYGGEIISADSRQVYRGMDIGTGKDLAEYGEIPHHLIDIAEPGEEYNLFRFVQDVSAAHTDICARKQLPFLVGGTGMYLDAILNRYKLTQSERFSHLQNQDDDSLRQQLLELRPNLHNTTDLIDRKRIIAALELALSEESNAPIVQGPDVHALTIGVQFERTITRKRITERLKARFDEGMMEEVQQLHDQGLRWEQLDFYGLEYRFIAQHLKGDLNYNDMFQKLNSAIHQFAKQQEKWFRNIEKKDQPIHWLDMNGDLVEQSKELIDSYLAT